MSYESRIDRLDKNYLINGGFDFYQRAGATVAVNTTTSSAYSGPDRWRVFHTGTFTGTPSIVRSTVIPSNNLTQYSNNWSFRRNGSTATLSYEQRIEARNCYEIFAAGKMSLSFYINSSIAPSGSQISVTISSANALDNFTTQTVQYTSFVAINAANTWQEIKFENISVPAAILNGMSVEIDFVYPSGTDASVQNSYLAQVMLNLGSVSHGFARFERTIGSELRACQRYFEKTFEIDTPLQQNVGILGLATIAPSTGGRVHVVWSFKATKRTNAYPVSTYNPTAANANFSSNPLSPIPESSTATSHGVMVFSTAANTNANNQYSIHLSVDAEL